MDRTGCWRALSDPHAELPEHERATLRRILALERLSEHPVAAAILDLCERAGIEATGLKVEDVEVAPGLGIKGRVEGVWILVARPNG